MIVLRVLVVAVVAVAGPVSAAVYEVGDDGSMSRIDTLVRPPVRKPVVSRSRSDGTSPRASAYRPYVAAAATQYELSPALIDAIAHTESRYDQAAVSRVGAAGIMQLMPGTARGLGVDSRDPASNIRGGTAYLRLLLNSFDGDVVRTIAAYNAGPGAVKRAGGIPHYPETVAYVSKVLDRLADAAD